MRTSELENMSNYSLRSEARMGQKIPQPKTSIHAVEQYTFFLKNRAPF